MYIIENQLLRITVKSTGAELQGIVHKLHSLEYLWNGDPAFWPKRSPVLFPIVGALKNNTYQFAGNGYDLGRHGFAREMEFVPESAEASGAVFLLESNESTRAHYPFDFEFRIGYQLEENRLTVTYNVKNTGHSEMYFSVGGHPAFRVPLVTGTSYNDYFIEFNEGETLARWPVTTEGLIGREPQRCLTGEDRMPLTKELFANDALVFKFPTSSMVSIRSDKTDHGVDMDISGFPYLGIWAAKEADFVCIEPWCGIADSVDTDQRLEHKEGIHRLAEAESFKRSWIASFF